MTNKTEINHCHDEIPRKTNKLPFLLLLAVLLIALALFFKTSGAGGAWLWSISQNGEWLLPLVAVSALLDSVNPCAFSILLLTIAFLFSIGKLRSGVLKIGVSYIAGLFLVYLLIGLGLLQTLHLFNTPHFMAKVGAALLLTLGAINIINQFFPAFPLKLRIPQAAHHKMAQLLERASWPTAIVLGGLVGICEFPCTGGPYLTAVGLLHDQVTYYKGLGYLLFYNALFVLPLVVILLIASDKRLLEKAQSWRQKEAGKMRLWAGAGMIALGIIILLL